VDIGNSDIKPLGVATPVILLVAKPLTMLQSTANRIAEFCPSTIIAGWAPVVTGNPCPLMVRVHPRRAKLCVTTCRQNGPDSVSGGRGGVCELRIGARRNSNEARFNRKKLRSLKVPPKIAKSAR
jgi:hypothetical protein